MLETRKINLVASLPKNPALEDFEGLSKTAANNLFDLPTKTEAIKKLTALLTFEPDKKLDQKGIGEFLAFAAKTHKDPNAPESLKATLAETLNPFMLDALAIRSSIDRWDFDATQALLEAYCAFLTIDKVFGPEKAKEFKKAYAKKMVFDKQFDLACEAGTFEEGRKGRVVINLGALGTEVAQDGIQLAYLDTAAGLKTDAYITPYYRSRYLVQGDEEKGLASYKTIMAELFRKEGGQHDAGLDIPCLGGTFDRDGKLIVHRAKPNVSSQLVPAVGAAVALRQNIIEAEGIVFDEPKRTDALRELKLENALDPMLIAMGDGSWINLPVALEFAALYRAPLIITCLNNGVAIGTKYEEIQTTPISAKGKGVNIPGIKIESSDFDSIILATRFAAIRASLDAGTTIIEIMAPRPVTHSTGGHANQLIAEYIDHIEDALKGSEAPEVRDFLKKGIYATTDKDTTFALKERVLKFIETANITSRGREKILEVTSNIVDPMAVVFTQFQEEGIISVSDIKKWEEEAKIKFRELRDELNNSSLPNPKIIGKNIRVPGPKIEVRSPDSLCKSVTREGEIIYVEKSDEKITKSGAEAQSELILERMLEDQGLIGGGIDINIGREVKYDKTEGYKRVHKGTYFHSWDGIHPALGHLPGRLYNFPIGENALTQFVLGLVTQPAHKIKADLERQIAILNGENLPFDPDKHIRRALVDLEYGDYGIQAYEALWINAGTLQNTSGQIIMPSVFLFPCAMIDGGGGMHSHSVEGALNTLPEGLDLFTVSSPSTLRNLLNYLLRFSNNPSAIVLDRKLYKATETWEKGTGFFQPGKDLIIQNGSDLQIITWGPATPAVRSSVQRLEERFGEKTSIGILEKISWRPEDYTDLEEFLLKGDGPIAIITEEFKKKSIGNLLVAELQDNPRFKQLVKERRLQRFATLDVSHPYCDKILMNGIRCFGDETLKKETKYEEDRLALNLAKLLP